MRTTIYFALIAFILFSCGGQGSTTDQVVQEVKTEPAVPADPYDAWETNHGIGPVTAFDLPAEIDQDLVAKGAEVYKIKCTACHKTDKRFIGPSPAGIFEKRTPAWVMNMILNPEEMVKQDPIAKKLLIEFNGAPMANQNLTEEEARAVLEFFRTL